MTKQELLLITIMTIYTMIIIVGLNRYESRIKDYKASISDYKRALSLSRNNNYSQTHYTQLQIENQSLRKSLYELDRDNDMLKRQLAQVRLELLESRPLQNESSSWDSLSTVIRIKDAEPSQSQKDNLSWQKEQVLQQQKDMKSKGENESSVYQSHIYANQQELELNPHYIKKNSQ